MCIQKAPHDHSAPLYKKYREVIEEYITSVVCFFVLIPFFSFSNKCPRKGPTIFFFLCLVEQLKGQPIDKLIEFAFQVTLWRIRFLCLEYQEKKIPYVHQNFIYIKEQSSTQNSCQYRFPTKDWAILNLLYSILLCIYKRLFPRLESVISRSHDINFTIVSRLPFCIRILYLEKKNQIM